MRNMGRRLNTIEKRLRPGRELKVGPPIIIGHCGRTPTPEDEQALGSVETWITYQQQFKAQEKANAETLKDHPGCLGHSIIINVNVDKEYQARQREQINE